MILFRVNDKVKVNNKKGKVINLKYDENGKLFTVFIKLKSGTVIEEYPHLVKLKKLFL